jgi:hypothetical protein
MIAAFDDDLIELDLDDVRDSTAPLSSVANLDDEDDQANPDFDESQAKILFDRVIACFAHSLQFQFQLSRICFWKSKNRGSFFL